MLNYHALGTDSSDQSYMEFSDIEWMMPDQDSKDLCKPLRKHIVQNTDWYWLSTHEKAVQEIKHLFVIKVQY